MAREAAVAEKESTVKRDCEGVRRSFEEADQEREVLRARAAELECQGALLEERRAALGEAKVTEAAREARVEEAEWRVAASLTTTERQAAATTSREESLRAREVAVTEFLSSL